jgi:pimeloyl-ACP methyl ester carboxylesterase
MLTVGHNTTHMLLSARTAGMALARHLATGSACSQTLAHKTLSIVDTDGVPRLVHAMQSSVAGGPPLLLLTGTGQSSVSYSSHVRALAEKLQRTVVCVDLRGQGQTQLR